MINVNIFLYISTIKEKLDYKPKGASGYEEKKGVNEVTIKAMDKVCGN